MNLEHFKHFSDIYDKVIDSYRAKAHKSDTFDLERVHFALVCYGYTLVCTLQAVIPCFLFHAVSQCGEWKMMVTILLFVVDYIS